MLACIACAKPEHEDGSGEEGSSARAATPGGNKDAVKSLTSQIKDMVLKFSGAYRQCKGGGGGTYRHKGVRHRHHHRTAYLHHDEDDDAASDGGGHYAYLRAASSNSTPAWDFTSIGGGGTSDTRFTASKWIPGAGEADDVVLEEDNGEPKEWMAQVEPGVHITFVSLPGGTGNDLKRIRFKEMFNKWQAQRWWGENYDRIMELYNVQRFSRQALHTPSRSDDGGERESFYSRVGSTRESPVTPPLAKDRLSRNAYRHPYAASGNGRGVASSSYLPSVPDPSEHILPYHLNPNLAGVSGLKGEASSVEASRTTTSSRDEAASISISNASDMEMTEWVEQDEPGVYITIRELADGTRELRRVRFSRERFGEGHAKLWWEENRERIQTQYL